MRRATRGARAAEDPPSVRDLERRAHQLHELLKYANRPLVVELAGTPKSGKSTTLDTVKHFFTRNGFRVQVLTERAEACPVAMKGHLFFNTWCLASALAELLGKLDAPADIILLDRGLFDSLMWLRLQGLRGEVNSNEEQTIASFILLARWCSLIDMVVVMRVDAAVALERERAPRISSKLGSIMNLDVLQEINHAIDDAASRYADYFIIYTFNTTESRQRPTAARIASRILSRFEAFANPLIAVVPRKLVLSLFGKNTTPEVRHCTRRMIREYEANLRFVHRRTAEESTKYVQLVPCGVFRSNHEVFVFRRREADPQSRLHGRATVLQACHLSATYRRVRLPKALARSLEAKIQRLLHLSRSLRINFAGCVWDPSSTSSERHVGFVHNIEAETPEIQGALRKKEFRLQRGERFSGSFVGIDKLAAANSGVDLESWSTALMAHYLK